MKDHLRQLIAERAGPLQKLCAAREYLQAHMLQSLQDAGVFRHWAFVGGTALRFLFSIPRFSEDLDFSQVPSAPMPDFNRAMKVIASDFEAEGYEVSLAIKSDKAVASASAKFPGLLHELGLSQQRSQVLSIKVEVDTNPPSGAGMATSLVRRLGFTLNMTHHDRASLLAGKVHTLFSRSYTKGRDLYDLIWYLSDRDWPPPNIPLLVAALVQTGWTGPVPDLVTWRGILAERLSSINWVTARAEIAPFLERDADRALVTRENVMGLLDPRGLS